MKKPTLTLFPILILCLFTEAIAEEKIHASISLFYLSGSGSPDAPYSGFANSRDYDAIAPRLTISYKITEDFDVIANYTDLGTFNTSWIGNQTPPLLGVGGRQAITPFEVREKMEAFAAGIGYTAKVGSGSLRLGIEVNHIKNVHNGWLIKNENDWSIAASVGYEHLLTDSLSISADYLYLSPPNKSLHLYGGSLKLKF